MPYHIIFYTKLTVRRDTMNICSYQNKPFLSVENVSFSYYSNLGEVQVLDDITFSVEKGNFVALVGPSGCGKSTILSLISGLIRPTKGYITFYSDDFAAPKVGYMLQHDHLLEWRDVYHNIMLGLEIQKNKSRENLDFIDDLLEKYNLSHVKKQKTSALSGGMRQRIALIRTLATKPDLLLLDEPFSALDYQTRLNVSKDVHDIIKSEKKTAILVTHDISEAISMADVVFVLTKSPCTLKDMVDIEFEANGIERADIRKSSLFQEYFDRIWREMQNENEE
jgi:NitT/TauT family transport system ATP-binding protein